MSALLIGMLNHFQTVCPDLSSHPYILAKECSASLLLTKKFFIQLFSLPWIIVSLYMHLCTVVCCESGIRHRCSKGSSRWPPIPHNAKTNNWNFHQRSSFQFETFQLETSPSLVPIIFTQARSKIRKLLVPWKLYKCKCLASFPPPLVGRWRESLVWFRTACAAVTSRVPAGGIIFHSFIFWKRVFQTGSKPKFSFFVHSKGAKETGFDKWRGFLFQKDPKKPPPPIFQETLMGKQRTRPIQRIKLFQTISFIFRLIKHILHHQRDFIQPGRVASRVLSSRQELGMTFGYESWNTGLGGNPFLEWLPCGQRCARFLPRKKLLGYTIPKSINSDRLLPTQVVFGTPAGAVILRMKFVNSENLFIKWKVCLMTINGAIFSFFF